MSKKNRFNTKKVLTGIGICFFSAVGIFMSGYHPMRGMEDKTVFYPDECAAGSSGSWTGACACFGGVTSGAYCDEEPMSVCTVDTKCLDDFYCNVDSSLLKKQQTGEGYCFKIVYYPVIHTSVGDIVISRSIMTYGSAEAFCASLGQQWRLAARSDFNCTDNGAGCIGNFVLVPIQDRVGIRGFGWLDNVSNHAQAYYMDFNDGNIYYMPKNTASIAQALCLNKKDNNDE